MSQLGQKRKWPVISPLSVLPPEADVVRPLRRVSFVPRRDSCTAANSIFIRSPNRQTDALGSSESRELFQFKFDELDASSAHIVQRAYCTGLLPDEITKPEDHLLVGMLRLTFNNVPPA